MSCPLSIAMLTQENERSQMQDQEGHRNGLFDTRRLLETLLMPWTNGQTEGQQRGGGSEQRNQACVCGK